MNKLFKKLSKREKVLILLGIVVVFGYGIYTYVYEPLKAEYEFEKNRYETQKKEIDRIEKALLPEGEIEDLIETFRVKVKELEKKLPPTIHQEKVIVDLFDYVAQTNVLVSSYGFSDNEQSTILYEEAEESVESKLLKFERIFQKNEDLDVTKDEKKELKNDYESLTGSLGVNFSFQGDYNHVKNLLLALETHESKVLIENISFAKGVYEGETMPEYEGALDNYVIGGLDLKFLYYYDLEDEKDFEWEILSKREEMSPFDYNYNKYKLIEESEEDSSSGESTNDSSTDESTQEETEEVVVEDDFYISIKPITSDRGPIAIEKSDEPSTGLISMDNFDRIKLVLNGSGGDYSYSYSTNNRSYPVDSEFESFEPLGDTIVVKVVSQKKISAKDTVSMILDLENNTDKKVQIYLYGDVDNRFNLGNVKGAYRLIDKQ